MRMANSPPWVGRKHTPSVLGVALNAEYIDIFTDGRHYDRRPQIVEDARLINDITYNEICQMAREGAKVVHPRAIEIAMQRAYPLESGLPFPILWVLWLEIA